MFSPVTVNNPTLLKAAGVALLFTVLATELRISNTILDTVNLAADQWAIAFAVSLAVTVIVEAKKLLKIRTTALTRPGEHGVAGVRRRLTTISSGFGPRRPRGAVLCLGRASGRHGFGRRGPVEKPERPRPVDGLGPRRGLQLAIDRLRLGLDGVGRPADLIRDLGQRAVSREERQQPELSERQHRRARRPADGPVELAPQLLDLLGQQTHRRLPSHPAPRPPRGARSADVGSARARNAVARSSRARTESHGTACPAVVRSRCARRASAIAC